MYKQWETAKVFKDRWGWTGNASGFLFRARDAFWRRLINVLHLALALEFETKAHDSCARIIWELE